MPATDQLSAWCYRFLPAHVSQEKPLSLTAVSGDAGFRSYYRVNSQPPLIAVLAPPDKEDNPAFVDKALYLLNNGIHVPAIYAVDYHQGFLLIEDLGSTLLLPELTAQTADPLYDLAEEVLLRMQALPSGGAQTWQQLAWKPLFEEYSAEKLREEMALFPVWFVGDLLGVSLSSKEMQLLESVFGQLVDSALEQPGVIVHRDYHARNLLLPRGQVLGVIDFQDAVTGPVTYDLVSLLRDCYIRWPDDWVESRARAYYNKAKAHGVLAGDEGEDRFVRWFDLMGMQRHIKVLGVFARLWLRDGKQPYLRDLPLVMRYLLEQSAKYPEFKEFSEWFIKVLVPLAEQQDWYQPWESAGE